MDVVERFRGLMQRRLKGRVNVTGKQHGRVELEWHRPGKKTPVRRVFDLDQITQEDLQDTLWSYTRWAQTLWPEDRK